MDDIFENNAIRQLESAIAIYEDNLVGSIRSTTNNRDIYAQFMTLGYAAIERIVGRNSVYFKQAETAVDLCLDLGDRVRSLAGSLQALLADVKSGYLKSIKELIHAGVFADFLDMAEYLLQERYKDPAAVIGGSVLEVHIIKLCVKNNIPLELEKNDGTLMNKNVDRLSADLMKADVYGKLDHKNISGWYGLRTHAAHGEYDEYTDIQVDLMLKGVSDFIQRNPA